LLGDSLLLLGGCVALGAWLLLRQREAGRWLTLLAIIVLYLGERAISVNAVLAGLALYLLVRYRRPLDTPTPDGAAYEARQPSPRKIT
jgi:hypothetical protein